MRDPLPEARGHAALIDLRVIGLGSPAGDDRAGWLLAEALAARPAARAMLDAGRLEIETLDRPGADLVRRLSGAHGVVLVDALQGAGAPGEILDLDAEALAGEPARLSGHGFGVAEALNLARALHMLPPRLWLHAIRGARFAPLDKPGAAVLAAVQRLAERLHATLPALAARPPHPHG